MGKESIKLIAQNKKARHEYFLEELFEAGISLSGTEVKSLRMGKCSLKESFVRIQNNEAFIWNMHISPYEKGNIFNRDPLRTRKLLLHRQEIKRLIGAVKTDGYTIIPVQVYFKGNYAKMQIALAKGKKLYDKRQDLAKKDQRREAEKDFKVKNLY
ncbi:SsrA-binding protein SmpB [Bianquea renquensis]|jgi:ssrA-binding protein|uniref:SsrA-binding protein n=1 Tax=Bianquea renquensis TaxID=2763661 RepID=A0A926DUS9_9FIRM|nr:SsrA-binding protein SmpB [Bianquea renquensis]MBC8544318.1 SsrA-binding protein SmpB [Bianquea renquensis]